MAHLTDDDRLGMEYCWNNDWYGKLTFLGMNLFKYAYHKSDMDCPGTESRPAR
jgi:hypothetical protein